ncbi:MAG: hypothetical protein QXG17_07905 [Sulfolobales archaeon]
MDPVLLLFTSLSKSTISSASLERPHPPSRARRHPPTGEHSKVGEGVFRFTGAGGILRSARPSKEPNATVSGFISVHIG